MAILRTSWDETWHILKRAVERGLARKVAEPTPRLGIDEKAFAKGQSYVTLLVDLDKSTVEAISDGNNTESAKTCFSQLSEAQLESIEAIAMDMSVAYHAVAIKHSGIMITADDVYYRKAARIGHVASLGNWGSNLF